MPSKRSLAALLLALLAAGPAAAAPPVVITAARVGLPAGPRPADADPNFRSGPVAKFAAWAPLSLELEVREAVTGPAELVVETPDGDDLGTTLVLPLAALASAKPGQTLTARDLAVKPYVRPGGDGGETVVRVRAVGGRDLADPFRIPGLYPSSARTYVALGLGTRLPGFDLPKPPATGTGNDDADGFRRGRVRTAALVNVDDLPDRWFGYDAADVVVVATGGATDDFLRRLFGDQTSAADRAKRDALLEWVRRGGRVVLGVGANAGLLAQFPAAQPLLPFAVKPDAPTVPLPKLAFRLSPNGGFTTLEAKSGTLPVANFTPRPDRPARVLLAGKVVGPARDNAPQPDLPIVVQSAFGLGRVTAVAFDLDRPPLADHPSRADVWDWLLRNGGADLASTGGDAKQTGSRYGLTEEEDEAAAALRSHVDTFEGVPVVSFGWVAVFIVLYILLVGPAEYYFLKKVVGRLELTWVTFPVIVLSVSALAYATAYAVKGRDLRVNKIDVVDVDVGGGRVDGRTWFTVFSPRIDSYTAAVTPADGWTADGPDAAARQTLTGWVAATRGGKAGLVRRQYSYHVGDDGAVLADALNDVPIQVWSTKSFTAAWSARLDPAAPAVESKLVHPPGEPAAVFGSFVNRMPFAELRDAVAVYAGQAYPLDGPLLPGAERQLVLDPQRARPVNVWLSENGDLDRLTATSDADDGRGRRGGREAPATAVAGAFPMLGVLFHEAAVRKDAGFGLKNASLRRLDQSWRLSPENKDEVIVVGRVSPPPGPAEETLGGKYSPSLLWLKGRPNAGQPRPPLAGAGRQETWVRLFLPVR